MATYAEIVARARQLQEAQRAQREADAAAAAQAAAEAAEASRSNTWGEALSNVPIQLLSGAVGLGQAAYGLGNIATLGVLDRVAGLSDNFQETQQTISGWQSAPTQRAAQNVSQAFVDEGVLAGLGEAVTSPAFLQQLVVGNLPSLLPGAAAARAGAVAGAANATARGLQGQAAQQAASQASQRALGRAVGGQVGGAVNVDTINAIEAEGGSELQQQLGGIGAGVLAGVAAPALMRLTGAGALEAAAANALPGGAALGVTGGIARNVLGGAGREAAEESAQSASERIAQNLFTPNTDLFAGVGEQAALGGLAGGLLGGGMGGVISMGDVRTSARTPLGQNLRDELRAANAELGNPLTPSGLGDSPVEDIDLGATSLPAEEVDLGATPLPGEGLPLPAVEELAVEEVAPAAAPLRSLYDITGRQPQVAQPTPPLMEVEEVAPPPRGGLLGVLDAQRSRGTLGGTDLFAGPLPAEGAFPQVVDAAPSESAPAPVPKAQQAIDFDAPAPTWKKALVRDLGLKPQHFRGQAWTQFEKAAQAAGVDPLSPNAAEFLTQVGRDLGGDPATAPLFVAKLVEKYGQAAPVEAPAASTAEAPPQMTLGEEMNQQATIDSAPVADDGLNNEMDAVAPTQGAEPGDRGSATPKIDAWLGRFRAQSAAREAAEAPELPRVTGSKQVRGGYTDGGTYYEVSLSDGRSARVFRQQGDGGVMLSGWILSEVDGQAVGGNQGVYLGETKAEALRELPNRIPATAPVATDFNQPQALNIDQTIQRNLRLDPTSDPYTATVDAYADLIMDANSSDMLDEYFIAIKNHPGWAKLKPADQDTLTNDFNLRYDALENGTARFDRAPAGERGGKAMDLTDFSMYVAAANRNRADGSPEIVPVETVADFEALTRHAAPGDARGVYADGQVYLIRENIPDVKQLAMTLAHERGHQGLDVLLGDRLPAVVNRLWTNAATRERIKAKMKLLGNANPEAGGMRRLAAEEVLADMLAGGEKVNGDVITKARSAVDNAFSALLGISNLKMTNAEVDALLRDTASVIRGASPASVDMKRSHLQGLEFAMTNPNEFVDGDPRFSRAVADLDEVITSATAEADGTKRNVADVVKDTGASALQSVRSIGTATAADKARKLALDTVPLNQLANLYDKFFGGQLGEFARLKRTKEATFNKLITAGKSLNYHGQDMGELSPMATANQIKAFAQKNPKRMEAWNQLQQVGTLYRLWPDRSMEQQSQLNYAETNFTQAEREQAHKDLTRLWKSVGTEGQQLYKETQALYSSLWNARFNALRSEIARVYKSDGQTDAEFYASDKFKSLYGDRIESAMNKMRTGPYSPLQRYGDYLVTVRSKEGKVEWFSGHDTIEEANAARAELLAGDYADTGAYSVSMPTLRREHNWELDGISQQTIRAIEQSVDGIVSQSADPQLHRAIREGLVEAYLQSLPQSSFLQHANRRKNTRGATTNAFRGFSDYTIKAARSVASLRYDGQISEKLVQLQETATQGANDESGIKRQRVLEAVKRQHAASIQTERSPVADALSQGGFLWFMSSPSQLIINAMQTPMVTLPRLAGSYGNAAALREIKRALSDFTKSRGNLLGEKSTLDVGSAERKVLQDLFERGTLDFTLSHDMASLANGETGVTMSSHWRRVLEVAGTFMHKSEVFNRQVVALAAARLEMQKRGVGHSVDGQALTDIADIADSATLTTQFDYSQSNKPTIMQGPWRKVIFQFQQYRVNMLAMMGKDIRDSFSGTPEEKATARRALAWMLGTQLALTGAVGTVLAPMAFFIADLFRDDDDLLDSRTDFVRSTPQILAHGLLSGALDLSRVGADGLVTFGGQYAPTDASAKEMFQFYVMQNIGPWAGLGANIFTGIEKAIAGDHVAAVKNLAPAGIRDVYKAFFEGQQGAKDSRQIVYYEPGVWDTVTGAMGLRSGGRREAEEVRGATYEASIRAQTLKQRYLGRLALGHATSDQDMINEAMDAIHEWNSSFPDMAVKGSDLRRSIVTRVRSQINASQYGAATSRAPARSIQEQVGTW